ncbi:MAG: hypothetical protein OEQ13_14110 [Acidobacteriota bacterium]|nr:hypothetical protein [Acidobacteriota bacterium]
METLRAQAERVAPLVETPLAHAFLAAVADLSLVETPRVVYYNRDTRDAVAENAAAALGDSALAGYERRELDDHFYYFTRYGTPLAFVRALELTGLESADGIDVLEFGFGSIGQLKLLAALGAHAVGVEVDPLLRALYAREGDTGEMPRAKVAGRGRRGTVRTLYGHFPAEPGLVSEVGGGYELFVSKNTLKRGYIHPEEDVDPRMLVHLGVDDETFVEALYALLEPGGLAMIYNLHPRQAGEGQPYIPWADGRCPFARDLCERVGFEVLAFDVDDSEAARAMGKAFGWDEQMDLKDDLFATYTLLRKQ